MIFTGGDVSKIRPEILEKVADVERQENHTARVRLLRLDEYVLCHVSFSLDTTYNPSVLFTSMNIAREGSSDYTAEMLDGKVSGFQDYEAGTVIRTPEDLANNVLHDIFVMGWD